MSELSFFQAFAHFDIFVSLVSLESVTNSILYVGVYCYYGDQTNECFEKNSNLLYNTDWVTMPHHLKKYLIIMMSYEQQTIFYYVFGGHPLNLQTCARVSRFFLTTSIYNIRTSTFLMSSIELLIICLFQFANSCYTYYMVCKTLDANH